jgi:predicted DsbA family dithiol-disulfide isomerase
MDNQTTATSTTALGGAERKLQIDIVSDSICPWCYIGKRRFAVALEVLAREGLAFEVSWKPFQLNPNMPREGLDRRQYRTAKFGSWEKSQALDAQVVEAGRSVGLSFRYDLMKKTPNTLASHVLVRLAREVGDASLEERAVEAVLAAYFTLGRDIGERDVLADIGETLGIERARVLHTLADPASTAAVIAAEEHARRLGLNGVPSFVFQDRFLFSGAQPVAEVVLTLREATRTSESPATATR